MHKPGDTVIAKPGSKTHEFLKDAGVSSIQRFKVNEVSIGGTTKVSCIDRIPNNRCKNHVLLHSSLEPCFWLESNALKPDFSDIDQKISLIKEIAGGV